MYVYITQHAARVATQVRQPRIRNGTRYVARRAETSTTVEANGRTVPHDIVPYPPPEWLLLMDIFEAVLQRLIFPPRKTKKTQTTGYYEYSKKRLIWKV